MKNNRCFSISRRPFLAGLGSAAGAAVFIRPLIAEAQTGQTPKRIFIHHYPCGTVAGINGFGLNNGTYAKWYWRPPNGSSGPSYTASPLLKLFDPVRASCLSIHGLIRGDRTQKIAGDKHTHGILYMTTGWVPIPMVNAMPELDAANAKQITFSATPWWRVAGKRSFHRSSWLPPRTRR